MPLLEEMGFSEIEFNGIIPKSNITDFTILGIFISNYLDTTIVVSRDDHKYFTFRETIFRPIEQKLTNHFPNSELLFINHFESPYNESYHYIKNGQSIRVDYLVCHALHFFHGKLNNLLTRMFKG